MTTVDDIRAGWPGPRQGASDIPIEYTLFARGAGHTAGGEHRAESLAAFASWRRAQGEQIAPRGDKLKAPVVVAARLRDGRRKDEAAEAITWLFYDSDNAGTWDGLRAALDAVGAAYILHESCSSVNGSKWHLLLPLASPLIVDGDPAAWKEAVYRPQYAHLCRVLSEVGGLACADPTVDDLAQPAFVGQRLTRYAPARRVEHRGGACLDWAALLTATGYVAAAPVRPQVESGGAARPAAAPHAQRAPESGAGAGAATLPEWIGGERRFTTEEYEEAHERALSYLASPRTPVSVSGRGGDQTLFEVAVKLLRGFPLASWERRAKMREQDAATEADSGLVGSYRVRAADAIEEAARMLAADWNRRCVAADGTPFPWDESRILYKLEQAARSSRLPGPDFWIFDDRRAKKNDPSTVAAAKGSDDVNSDNRKVAQDMNEGKPTLKVIDGGKSDGGSSDRKRRREDADDIHDERRQEYARVLGAEAARELRLSDKGVPFGDAGNLITILLHHRDWYRAMPTFQHVLSWNALSLRVEKTMAPPFASEHGAASGAWDEEDDVRLVAWIAKHFNGMRATKEAVYDAVRVVSKRNETHPVRDYLNALEWDGKPRIDTWIPRLLGAEATPYHRLVGRYMLISCVARAMDPGCKVDTMAVLEGKQGAGKSQAIEALTAGINQRVYADTPIDLGSKDRFGALRGIWIYEWAELAGHSRRESEVTKAFLSSRCDKYRPPYARHDVETPRQCVFVASVNPAEEDAGAYLTDSTGGRRYWPVRCGGQIDVEGIRAERDQLWAEAVAVYRGTPRWWPTQEEEAAHFAAEQEARSAGCDAWDDAVAAWLRGREDAEHHITAALALREAVGLPEARTGIVERRRIGRILRRYGYEPRAARVGRGQGAVAQVFEQVIEDREAWDEVCDMFDQLPPERRDRAYQSSRVGRLTRDEIARVRARVAEVLASG